MKTNKSTKREKQKQKRKQSNEYKVCETNERQTNQLTNG